MKPQSVNEKIAGNKKNRSGANNGKKAILSPEIGYFRDKDKQNNHQGAAPRQIVRNHCSGAGCFSEEISSVFVFIYTLQTRFLPDALAR